MILLLLGAAASVLRFTRGMRFEKATWLLYAALILCLTRSVWCEDWAFFRAFSECYLFGTMIVLAATGAARRSLIPLWLAGRFAIALIVLKH